MLIAFFQKDFYRKKGTWDAKTFKTHFSYKISLRLWIIFGAETLKHSISFLTDFSNFRLHTAIPLRTPSKTCKAENLYTCRRVRTHIYILKVSGILNRGLQLITKLNQWTDCIFPKLQYLKAHSSEIQHIYIKQFNIYEEIIKLRTS